MWVCAVCQKWKKKREREKTRGYWWRSVFCRGKSEQTSKHRHRHMQATNGMVERIRFKQKNEELVTNDVRKETNVSNTKPIFRNIIIIQKNVVRERAEERASERWRRQRQWCVERKRGITKWPHFNANERREIAYLFIYLCLCECVCCCTYREHAYTVMAIFGKNTGLNVIKEWEREQEIDEKQERITILPKQSYRQRKYIDKRRISPIPSAWTVSCLSFFRCCCCYSRCRSMLLFMSFAVDFPLFNCNRQHNAKHFGKNSKHNWITNQTEGQRLRISV